MIDGTAIAKHMPEGEQYLGQRALEAKGEVRFHYRDPRTGKWIRAGYVATREEIAGRYIESEVIGQAEVPDVDPDARAFSPHALFKQMMDAELRRFGERPPDLQPAIDATEAFLLAVFLRRYVTYCAGRGRYAAMNGAARLFESVRASC